MPFKSVSLLFFVLDSLVDDSTVLVFAIRCVAYRNLIKNREHHVYLKLEAFRVDNPDYRWINCVFVSLVWPFISCSCSCGCEFFSGNLNNNRCTIAMRETKWRVDKELRFFFCVWVTVIWFPGSARCRSREGGFWHSSRLGLSKLDNRFFWWIKSHPNHLILIGCCINVNQSLLKMKP